MTSMVGDMGSVRDPLYGKLKPGPGSSADQVVAHQRARLCGAMVELTAERGYNGVTVRELSRLAAVSTKTFYDCFANIEDCFNATYVRIALRIVARASAVSGVGENRLRSAISEAFAYLDQDPKGAHFVLVESIPLGASSSDHVRGATVALERLVNEEVVRSGGAAPVHPMLVYGAVGAAMRVARTRILPARPCREDDLVDRFSGWLHDLLDGEAPDGRGSRPAEQGTKVMPSRLSSGIADDRSFLLAAVLRLAARERYASLTAPAIRREAGVSRRSFDQYFDGVEDCFLTALESYFSNATNRPLRWARQASTWDEAVVRTVAGVCDWMARCPVEARLVIVDITTPGRVGLERREAIVGRWADRLRRTAPAGIRPDAIAAESSIAAAWCLAKRHLTLSGGEQMDRLFAHLCFVLLAPAVGARRAEDAISTSLE